MLRVRAVLAAVVACVLISACGGSPQRSAMGSVHPAGWGATPAGFIAPRALFTAQPTATMFDAVTVGNIPGHPFAAAGYTAGNFVTWGWVRSHAQHAISIAIQASFRADCLDVEPFDATPAQAGPWVLSDIRAGFRKPCLYSDLSEMPAVQASLRQSLGAGWRARVFLWLAWYRRIPGLVPGYDAVQFDDHCLGRNLDCSTVSLAFLSIAQPPYKPAPPLPMCVHRRESRAACSVARAKIASDQRAAAASARALRIADGRLARHSCQRPFRRATCVRSGALARTFEHRVAWFEAQAAAIEGSN
ncbi:MAG: hypothetical protein ACYCQK_02095 [Acidiferrobacteraceae bacterium]